MSRSSWCFVSVLCCLLHFAILSSADDQTAASLEGKDWRIGKPFWAGDVVEGESVLFIRDDVTGEATAELLFPVSEVLEVTRAVDWTVPDGMRFEPGRDFVVEEGSNRIRLPKDSRIHSFSKDQLRRPAGSQKYRLTHRDGNGEILFGATHEYHQMQVCVTYRHSAMWTGSVPKFDSEALPQTIAKLKAKQAVSIVLLGDSISTGCNASGWAECSPHQPAYQDLLVRHLQLESSTEVSLTNLAVGGTSTPWGITRVSDVVAAKPDLVILAFGMNDSAGRSAEEFKANMQTMIRSVRESQPEAEFILIATMLGNADWVTLNQGLFPQYRDALASLQEPGIALADMTSIWAEMLKRKKDGDLTGNGVNHPNDFGHRVYAQVLTTLLIDPASSDKTTKTKTTSATVSDQPMEMPLWDGKPPLANDDSEASKAKITVHIPKNPGGSGIIICPGGGYGGLVTGPEGHGIAKWLNSQGVIGIVLEYRLPAGRHPVPLMDAQRAIQLARYHAEKWKINPHQLGIMGFSAGGHLASTAATHFQTEPKENPYDEASNLSNRPDFAILVYPVITMGEKTHGGSRTNLLGANPSQELIDLYSNEKQVTDKTPPAFITHAIDDGPVPVAHSQQFFAALQAKNVASKYLELPSGGHGLDGYKGPMWDAWQKQSLEWLAEQKLVEIRKQ